MNKFNRCASIATLLFMMASLGMVTPAWAAIVVTIQSPSAGALIGNELKITASVQSEYEIQEVTADLGGMTLPLVFSQSAICGRWGCNPGWSGVVAMAGKPEGSQTLKVTARDITGSTGQASTSFVHDTPPTVSMTLPEDQAVTSGSLKIQATCSDLAAGGCTSITATTGGSYGGGTVIASGQGKIDGEYSFTQWNGQSLSLTITGKDSAGQTSSISRTVYVETSPMLKRIQSADGRIWDADASRMLVLGMEEGKPSLSIMQRSSGMKTAISDPGMTPIYGYLSSRGALYVEQSGSVLTSRLYDWRDGALIDLGGLNSTQSLKVAGSYAIWNEGIGSGPQLHFRDEGTGKESIIASNAGNWMNSVASNGAVAYWTYDRNATDYNISFYQNGQTRKLTQDTEVWNTYPLTDGRNVVYRKGSKCCSNQQYAIYLHDQTSEIMLAPPRSADPSAGRDYAINNGWAAYTRQANDGTLQAWTRSPAGVSRQASFLGTSSAIAGLASNGQLMFSNGGNVYFDTGNITPLKVGSSLISPYFQNERWWTFIGNTLFSISTQSVKLDIVTSGEGSVSSNPAGIDCGSTCSMTTGGETPVTLTAKAADGYRFTGWSGACSGSQTSCTLTPSSNTSVKASFAQKTLYQLNLSFTGNGQGQVTSSTGNVLCQKSCSVTLESGTTVLLSATPATGSAFDGWSGDCSGRQTCQVVLDGNKTVASMFASTRLQPSLSLTASPVKASLGSSILLTSLLKKTSNSSPRPSGTILFRDGARTIFTGNLNSTLRNTTSLKSLDAGSHNITASYSGDSLYASAESSTVKVEILPLSTRTVLSAKPTTLKSTAKLTLSASVTPARTSQWTPAGQVTFYQGSKVLGSGTISSGKATLELQLAKGIYGITARYEGDARYTGSTSSSVRITVTP